MTPDEQHTQYFDKNPQGNHTSPSPETLRMFGDLRDTMKSHVDAYVEHIKEHEVYRAEMKAFMSSIDKKLDINTVKTEEGMAHINRRLDIANGRTAKLESKAETNEKEILILKERTGNLQSESVTRKKNISEIFVDTIKWAVTGIIGGATSLITYFIIN